MITCSVHAYVIGLIHDYIYIGTAIYIYKPYLQNSTNLRLIYIISCNSYLALTIIINGIIIIIVIYYI